MPTARAHWLFIAIAAAGIGAPAARGQGPAGASSTGVSSDTAPVIRIGAAVVDERGRPVAGLQAADFELLVDGRPHQIDRAEAGIDAARPRAFAFLLDEFHTAAEDAAAMRDGLLRFVERHIRPDDLAFAVKPLDSLTAIRPAMDRDALRRAIATFDGRKGDYSPRTDFERNYMAQAPAAVAHARGQIVTSALRAIGLALAQATDVRPVIVLVSDGFERMRTSRDVPANLQAAVRVANRADAPVYAFASRATTDTGDGEGPAIAALGSLAAQTGGELVVGASQLEAGLGRMLRDLDTRYVLTYRAAHGGDGRFHTLRVGVKRAGAHVRARTGYVAPLSAEMRAALTPAPSTPLRVLRRSPLIQSWYGITPIDRDRVAVTLTWEPAILRSGPAQKPRPATIVLTASAGSSILFDGAIAPAAEPGTPQVPNRATFEAPPGPVLVDVKILDARGVVLDTDARDVNVPRIRAGIPAVFPPEVIRARSARDFRAALRQGTLAPVATRDFWRTDRLLIRVPAVDSSGIPVPVNGVVLNRWRQPMRAITPLNEPGLPGAATLFDLPLAGFAPGEYTVRFTVTHAGGTVAEHVTFRVQG